MLSLNSFGDFFGGNGILKQFFNQYLKPFVNINTQPWHLYQVGPYSIGISANTLAQLQTADQIRRLFFVHNDNAPFVVFTIQPVYLDPKASSFSLQMADQSLMYRHGPSLLMTWHWPNVSESIQQTSYSFSDFSGQNFSQTYNGPWGWFKLLAQSQLLPTDLPGHYLFTISNQNHEMTFNLTMPNDSPMVDLHIFNNFSLSREP